MTTPNRLDITQGYLGHHDTVGHNDYGVPISEWRSFAVHIQPGRWQEWLERGESFTVQGICPDGAVGKYTARSEQIKGKQSRFWYAYKRVDGKLKKLYIGRSEDLTLDRLREVMGKF